MQINEAMNVTNVSKSEPQNQSGLEKGDLSFAKLLGQFQKSIPALSQANDTEIMVELSQEEMLAELKNLLSNQATEGDQLLELAAMMGQNSPMQAIQSLTNQDSLIQSMAMGQEEAELIPTLGQPIQNIGGQGQEMEKIGSVKTENANLQSQTIAKNAEVLVAEKSLVVDQKNPDQQKELALSQKQEISVKAEDNKVSQVNVKNLASQLNDQQEVANKQPIRKEEPMAKEGTSLLNDQKSDESILQMPNAIDFNAPKTAGLESLSTDTIAQEIPLSKQVEGKILEQFDGKTGKVFKMTLNPESLGEIEVELQVNHGKLVIGILSASQETHDLLTRQLDQLIRGLALQKVQVESVQNHRFVEESKDAQAQPNFSNSDFNQQQQQKSENPYFKGYQRHLGQNSWQAGESISDSLSQLVSSNQQFNRLDYRI